ncbi:hypothetical protein QL285_008070 [Trifolium repens]|nr:hypothetical protein QL285_008070 [Trifolium repens]
MFIYAENNVGTSSTMSQEFRENHASKRFAHSPLLNVDDQFVVPSPSTPSCNKTINAKSNQTNLSNTSSPDMNFESPVSFVCNNTLGEASIGHNIYRSFSDADNDDDGFDLSLVEDLKNMLDDSNPLCIWFRKVPDIVEQGERPKLALRLSREERSTNHFLKYYWFIKLEGHGEAPTKQVVMVRS